MERTRLTKVAKIVSALDKIAGEVEKNDERIALKIDQISDSFEKVAFSPQGWIPGRGMGPGRGRGFGMGWNPGTRFKVDQPGKKPDAGGVCVCPSCGTKILIRRAPVPQVCVKCGSDLQRKY